MILLEKLFVLVISSMLLKLKVLEIMSIWGLVYHVDCIWVALYFV